MYYYSLWSSGALTVDDIFRGWGSYRTVSRTTLMNCDLASTATSRLNSARLPACPSQIGFQNGGVCCTAWVPDHSWAKFVCWW